MSWCLASQRSGCSEHPHRESPIAGLVAPASWAIGAIGYRLYEIQTLRPWELPDAVRRVQVGRCETGKLRIHVENCRPEHALLPADFNLPRQAALGGLSPGRARSQFGASDLLLQTSHAGDAIAFPWQLRGSLGHALASPVRLSGEEVSLLDHNLQRHASAIAEAIRPGGLIWVNTEMCRRFWPTAGKRHLLLLVERMAHKERQEQWRALLGTRRQPDSSDCVVLAPMNPDPNDVISPPRYGTRFRFTGHGTTYFQMSDQRLSRRDIRLCALGVGPSVVEEDIPSLLARVESLSAKPS